MSFLKRRPRRDSWASTRWTLVPGLHKRGEVEEFDQSWTWIAVCRTLERLRAQNLRYCPVAQDLLDTDGEWHPDLAERVDSGRSQFPVLLHRVRTRFNHLFKAELSETVGNQQAFEDEWRALAPYVAHHARKRKGPDADRQ